MHTKFRPIVTESSRKSNSVQNDSTKAISTKVLKPIAISAWVKPEAVLPPLASNDIGNNKVRLLKPVPLIEGSNISLDEQLSETSPGKEHGYLYSHTSAPHGTRYVAHEFESARRFRSLDHPAVAGDHNISDSIRKDKDPQDSDSECLGDREEEGGRSDSGNSQKQVGRTNTWQAKLENEALLTSLSNNSGPSPSESTFPESVTADRENAESETCDAKIKLECHTRPHSHEADHENDRFDKNTSISSRMSEPEVRSSSNDANSSGTRLDEGTSDEVPLFSDVLESEGSSEADKQEISPEKVGNQDSVRPPSSSATSNEESCDEGEAGSSVKIRKTSSGNRISLRLMERKRSGISASVDSALRRMERKQSSTSATDDLGENPWFENKSSNNAENDDEERLNAENDTSENDTWKRGKEKKKKLRRFTRLFRSMKSGEMSSKDESMGSSSDDLSIRASLSDGSSLPVADLSPKPDASEEYLEATLALAISGKRNLDEVTDSLLGLSERPCDKVMKLLTKYMCSTVVIDAAFRIILEHEHARKADIPMKSMAPSHARYSPHREALINLFANGPQRLKKALLNHTKARSEILRFFTEERPEGGAEIPYWISTATSLSKILNGLLAHFPAEISEYIGGKKGVLHLMIKNHTHVPEVVEFVVQLSAANALSTTTGEDLRYGAANATGLVLLVKEGICDLLVDIFKKSSIATAQGDAHPLEWQTQVMSTKCLLELSKRAIVIPRFTKDNCSYSSRYIKTLNSSLDDLSLFIHDARVLSLLNAGFDAVSDGPEIENVREQSERNNPLVCALAVIAELLDTVRVGAGSKLGVTRRTVGSTNTEKIEQHLVSKMARLCKLLHRKSAHEVSCRAKVAIVNVFRCLCSSKFEATRLAMVKSQIPDRLMVLIRENERSSVLHSCVLKCISASFSSAHSIELHREWLRALARSDGWLQIMYEYFHKENEGEEHGCKPFFNTFVAIGFRLMEFCEDDKEAKLRPMLKTKAERQIYVDSIETGLIRMRKGYETPCGGPKPSERAVSVLANAETLAARLHDFNAV